MPNRKRVRRFDSALIAAALALAASSPAASANHTDSNDSGSGSGSVAVDCAPGPVHQAFSAYGDANWYYLAPGGDFEDELIWDRSGLSGLIPFSSPLALTGILGESSLGMARGSRVTSPPFCVNAEHPHVRFAALALRGKDLEIRVRLYDSDGDVTDRSKREISPEDHRAWSPSEFVWLNTDELEPGETALVDLQIRSKGEWLIDDVFIDPYRRG